MVQLPFADALKLQWNVNTNPKEPRQYMVKSPGFDSCLQVSSHKVPLVPAGSVWQAADLGSG